MTISSDTRVAGPFLCNGATVAYPFTFKIFTAADIAVTLTTALGVDSALVLTTDYAVALNEDQDANPGGTVTAALVYATGNKITLTTAITALQSTDLTNQGGFYPSVITKAFDKLTILIQQLTGPVNRSIKFPASDGPLPSMLPSIAVRASKFLAFDSAGRPIVAAAGADSLIRADLATPSGAAGVGFGQPSGPARTVQQQLDMLYYKIADITDTQYAGGADPFGVRDSTAAINAAIASGKQVWAPTGTYLYDGGGVLAAGQIFTGAGRKSTFLKARTAIGGASGFLLNALNDAAGIRSVGFLSGVAQTAGSYVLLGGSEAFVDDFGMVGDYNGILMTGVVARIRHGRFNAGVANAIRIRAEGGDASQMIDDVLMGAQSPPNICTAGIRVRNSSALMITNTSVIQQGTGLLIDPTSAAESVYSLYANTCFFDNGSVGVKVNATGAANVVRCRLSNVWASSSSTDGISIVNAGTGVVSGIHAESAHAVLNGGSGLTTGGTVSDISVGGGEYCQNTYGVFANAGTTNIRICNATIGTGAGLAGNSNTGVVISLGVDQFVVTGNNLTGNTTSIINNSLSVNRILDDNIGFASKQSGTSAIAGGATSVVIGHGLSASPAAADVLVTALSTTGTTPLFVDSTSINSVSFTVRCSAAAAGTLNFAWQARLGGS